MLVRGLSRRIGTAHVELDFLYHGPGWTERSWEESHELAAAALAGSGGRWVVCGNYTSLAPPELWEPEPVVWLDLPRRVVMTRVIRRTPGCVLLRRELWNGNREQVRGLWTRDGIVRWAWRTHTSNRRRYEQLAGAGEAGWVRLRSRRQVRDWLDSVSAADGVER